MRFYPEFLIAPLMVLIPAGVVLYFVIYFAVLRALRKHEKTKS